MSDPEGRRTLSDVVADRPERLFHVGRLDTDTVRADHAHQRRRLRAAARAPVVRGGQDLRRRGRRRGHQGDAAQPARRRHPRRRPGHGHAAPDRAARHGQDRSSSWSSTRAATGSSAGCSTTSATRSRRLTRTRIGPVELGQLKSGELRDLTLDELGELLDTRRALSCPAGLVRDDSAGLERSRRPHVTDYPDRAADRSMPWRPSRRCWRRTSPRWWPTTSTWARPACTAGCRRRR